MKKIQASKNQAIEHRFGAPSDFRVLVVVGICAIVVILGYVWLISAGHWISWSERTNYYYQLANAFDHGQLSLQIKTDPGLLSLSDPYKNSIQRNALPFPWDASFYHGKFYLYWGPVPALFLAFLHFLYKGDIGDQYVLFAALVGSFFFSLLILRSLWNDFFNSLPTWTLVLSIFLVGFVNPIPWLLESHRIYDAAIASGQFFFLGGLYWVYSNLRRPVLSTGVLGLAGVFWTLAIGSRVTLTFPIVLVICITGLYIARSAIRPKGLVQIVPACAAFGLPLIMGGIGYGWYNWSRFGSVFEFGLHYQLNNYDLHKNFDSLFSRSYFFSNFYNYMAAGFFKIKSTFPFLVVKAGKSLLGNGIAHQGIYSVQRITGILYSFPFAAFALMPLIFAALILSGKGSSRDLSNAREITPIYPITLAVCLLLGFIPLLFYFWVEMRFLFDFIPELGLLSVLGFWQSYRYISQKPIARMLLSSIAIGLALFSIAFSLILGFSN